MPRRNLTHLQSQARATEATTRNELPRHAAHSSWKFPFSAPGRPGRTNLGVPGRLTEYRWPFRRLEHQTIPNRGVESPIELEEFKQTLLEFCDDVGVISIDDPAIAHERDEILYV